MRYNVNGAWSNLMWFHMTEKKKEKIRVLIKNHLLNAIVCSSCLHLLTLFFPAFLCRLLLRSCCWKSRWDWSVILWQITTMPVGLSAISPSAGVPSEVGLLSAGGWQHSFRGGVGRAERYSWSVAVLPDWLCTETLHPCCCVVFYRFKTAWISFFPLKRKRHFFMSF